MFTCDIPTSNSYDHLQTNASSLEMEKQVAAQTNRSGAPKAFQYKVLVNNLFLEDYNNLNKNWKKREDWQ